MPVKKQEEDDRISRWEDFGCVLKILVAMAIPFVVAIFSSVKPHQGFGGQ